MKLQYKFASVIFGIGGVFLLAISLMYFFETREGDIHSQRQTFEQRAKERAEHIGLTLKEKAHIASILSRSHLVISGLEASNAQFAGLDADKRNGEIKRLNEAWTQAKNENDPFVRPYMTNAVAEFFKDQERAFPGEYGEIFLTNKYGAIIATTKKLTTLAHSHKYWWIAAYNGGKGRVFFDDRGYDMSAKGYVIGVTMPVVKDGEVIGILKCNHDITATLSRIVESFRPGKTGNLMIVRGKGKIVLAPGVKPLSSDAPVALVQNMAGRVSGSLILNEGGVQELTAYAPMNLANGEGEYGFGGTADSIDHLLGNRGEQWFVVISQSMEEAIAGSYERTREIALNGIVLIALMGLFAMYFGGRMALPVTRMEKYARRIGEGDYDIPVEATPSDEMGNLASAFNQMAVNLRTTTTSRDKLAEEVEKRIETEEKLKESEQRFRQLAEATFEGITITEKGRFLDVNRMFLDMFGYETVEELAGRNAGELAAPEYREIVAANIAAGYETPYEIMGMRKDGSFFPIEIRARMMEIAGRRMRVTAIRDMTERKRAEEERQKASDSFHKIASRVPGVVYQFRARPDGSFCFPYASDAFHDIARISPEEVREDAAKAFAVVHPDDFGPLMAAVQESARDLTPWRHEFRIKFDDGEERWLFGNAIPEREADGATLWHGVISDITERKMAQEKIRESNEILERMFETTHFHVVLLDTKFNFIRVNKAYADVCGFPPEYFIGKNHFDLYPSEEVESKFRRVVETGVPYTVYSRPFEFPGKPERGVTYWDLAVYPVNGASGKVEGLLFTLLDVTERKKAEKVLWETRLFLDSIIENIPAMMFVKRASDLRFELFNRAGEELLGYSRGDLLGKCDYDFFPKEQADCFTAADRKVLASEEITDIPEEPIKTANGETRYLHTWKIALRDEAGVPSHLLGISLDITDRKKAEEAVRESEARFRLVADSAPVLIWMSGTDAKCHYFNKGWLDFTGRPLEDEMGDGWAQGVHPHDRARCVDLYMAAFDARNKFSIVYRLRRRDGKYRWVLDSGIPRFSTSGDFLGYIGSCIDITDRKEAEEALARSEKKIRDITSVIGQGVFALDAGGCLTFMNPEAERLLGWKEAELLGSDVHRIFHGKRDDGSVIKRGECPAHIALGTGQSQKAEGELLTKKDGGMFHASIVATPMTEDGLVAGVVVAFSDITERQRIMREIMDAKEQAEEATKLKDKFVSLVAHDLKSPFTGIIGLLQVMKENEAHPLDEQNRDIMNHVLRSGQQMLRMIDELLDISRLKTGKIKPDPRFFDGAAVAAMALARISPQAAGKGVTIKNEIPPGTRLYADLNLFDEVLQNLLTNAVKFSARGGVVTVFSPGDGVVAVRDTGVGIKKNFLPFLFRHEEKTTSPGTEGELGTGLGLPLSHDMMEAMGGSLAVDAEKGAGSVFYATLPHVIPVALVVDDQASVRYLLRQHLARIGVSVVEAEDGEQALSLIRQARPHLVVTDITMPRMSGFDLLEAIRKDPETASLPVIVMTADNQVESREKSFRMGADDFVSKPLKAEDLIPRVRRFLG